MRILILAFLAITVALPSQSALAGKAPAKSAKHRKSARGPVVIRMNSPEAADQSRIVDTNLEQRCLTAEQKRLLTWKLGVQEQDLQHFVLDANTVDNPVRGAECLHYASAFAP